MPGIHGPLMAATYPDAIMFVVSAVLVLAGAIGVIASRNPVHSALSLVMTLFGVALIFLAQQADFIAAVQVIVYAGAIVVLFLFVVMFLGVDRLENLVVEPLRFQRVLALGLVALSVVGMLLLGVGAHWAIGAHSVTAPALNQPGGDVAALGKSVFTAYLLPFEATAALLIIAIIGAVVLTRRQPAAGEEGDAVEDTQGAGGGGAPAQERSNQADADGVDPDGAAGGQGSPREAPSRSSRGAPGETDSRAAEDGEPGTVRRAGEEVLR